MPRWEPDGRERLIAAALELFTERGYDGTTVVDIAERAGLTKSTFFRYFPDKKDVFAAGQETLSRLLVDGISAAPADASPLDVVRSGLESAAGMMTSVQRRFGPQLRAVIASSTELQARDRLKQQGLAENVADALRARGVAATTAALAADIGMLAFGIAYAAWIVPDNRREFTDLVGTALDDLRAALPDLG
ncbi:TetR/AcrR family transcriptional regulator [Rathayibacter sp. CAU 1779]